MQFLKYSEKSSTHAENEDFGIHKRHPSGGERYLCFIADGQGGREDGAEASRIACQEALEYSKTHSWDNILSSTFWDNLVAHIDSSVRENCNGLTTFIGFAIDPSILMGTSVGDSKLYFFNGNSISEPTLQQRKNPPIGGGCNFGRVFSIVKPVGQLLAATDGVWKYSGYEAIEESLRSDPHQIENILRRKCELRSGGLPDDFTFIAISTT